jgi:hypothetical protein
MLRLKDIYLGNIDAKNELLANSPDQRARFVAAFVRPPNLTIEEFVNREKYFVLGLKGTGKTALLRYISISLEEVDKAYSAFVLFKSDIDEETRSEFGKTARLLFASANAESFEGTDFEAIWRWFIYRKIVESVDLVDASPFHGTAQWESFKALVRSEAMRTKETGLMRLVPKLTKGQIEISKNPKLSLDLDWDSSGVARMKFIDLVRKADAIFNDLSPDSYRLNIFFDELELNYTADSQFERDVRMLRDLIVSIEKINGICKAKGFNLCLYAAIRSEVLNAVAALGKEINKPLADFGTEILWNRPGHDASRQPLIYIIEQRLANARAENNMKPLNSANLWGQYFPAQIEQMAPQRYILHHTWYRPRDVVRLLRAATEQFPSEQIFTVNVFETIRKKYSAACWVEVTEELKAKYSSIGIEGIKQILQGIRPPVTPQFLDDRIATLRKGSTEVDHLAKKASTKTLVADLYRLGVLGNSHQGKLRFSFRGDDDVVPDQKLIVHNALRSYLSIR